MWHLHIPDAFWDVKIAVFEVAKKGTASFAKMGWMGYLILGGLRANLDDDDNNHNHNHNHNHNQQEQQEKQRQQTATGL